MPKLNDLDAKVLRFIRETPSCAIDTIEKALLGVDAMESRIQCLQDSGFVRMDFLETKEGTLTHRIPLFTYKITATGRRELQDYDHATRKGHRDLWLKNAWIPILVSFLTTVLANYILPRLPEMLEWFRRILARTPA